MSRLDIDYHVSLDFDLIKEIQDLSTIEKMEDKDDMIQALESINKLCEVWIMTR